MVDTVTLAAEALPLTEKPGPTEVRLNYVAVVARKL